MSSWQVDSAAEDWNQPVPGYVFLDEASKASLMPVFVSVAVLAVSVLSLFISSAADETSTLRVGVAALAYLLTPFVTAGALVWAMKAHRSHGANDAYDSGSGLKVVRLCSMVAFLGFVAAIPQIWIVSDYFALLFGGGM